MRKLPIFSLFLTGVITLSSFSPIYAAETSSNPIVQSAQKYIGFSLKNYDAADFIYYTLKDQGITVSKNLTTQYQQGTPVSVSQLKPGDVAYFGTSSTNLFASGVYLGNNQVAVAYKPYGEVKVLSTNSSIVIKNLEGLRRFDSSSNTGGDSQETTKPASSKPVNSNVQQALIDAGLKYLGTPYEYSSSRSNTRTFDCSDFVRQVYLDAVGLDLGRGGATSQYNYLKKSGAKIKTDWRDLEVGDIMIFMPYRGTSADKYEDNRDSIGHSGIYMGNGKILHTYSKESGGVRINEIKGHWAYRFIAGGSPL